MTGSSVSIAERAAEWAAGDPDEVTRAELLALVRAGDDGALRACFEPALTFGTAGLRGLVGPGPARMNHAVIRRTTAAVAGYLQKEVLGAREQPVIVGWDARHSSRAFAETVIGVLAAARLPVRHFTEPVPTPLVAFAVRRLGASAGIVITASHNPRDYNGYKLYGPDGCQIIAPADADIEARIRAAGPALSIPVRGTGSLPDGDGVRPLESSIIRGYLDSIALLRPPGKADRGFPIVYTPLHGVGGALATEALARGGFSAVTVVPRQAAPDGDFPTVSFPNPEEPGALDLAMELAASSGAELVLANDPDADRLAVAVRAPSGRFVQLTGNQIGVLLADFLLARLPPGQRPLVVWSIVSSPLLASVAAAYGARAERTLTGFKWIARAGLALEASAGLRFVLGYEEALGFAVGGDVRDKDGISAAVVFAELAAQARARGRSVLDELAAVYRRHGLWVSTQKSVVRDAAGLPALVLAVDRLAAAAPASLAGYPVSGVRDYRQGAAERPPWLGATPLIELSLGDAGRVLLRPSGTEPKLKIYVDLRADVPAEAALWEAEERLGSTARGVAASVAELVTEVEGR